MPRCFSISIQSEVAWRAGLARLDAAGDLDRAREQQQLFGQRGLARVGVRNDGKGAAAAHLVGSRLDMGCAPRGRASGKPAIIPARSKRPAGPCPSCPTSPSTSKAWPPSCVATRCERVRVLNPFVLRTAVPPIAAAEGRRVVGVERLGKRVVLALDGRALPRDPPDDRRAPEAGWRRGAKPPAKGALASFEFDGGTLVLTEAGTKRRASTAPAWPGARRWRRSIRAASTCSPATPTAFARQLARENHTLKRCADQPAPVQRHRQCLLRRDPAPRAAVAGRADAQADAGDAQRLSRRHARGAGRMDRALARRGGAPGRLAREGDRVPPRDGRARPLRPALPGVRRHRCSASCTPTTRPTTARAARPAAGCWPTARCRRLLKAQLAAPHRRLGVAIPPAASATSRLSSRGCPGAASAGLPSAGRSPFPRSGTRCARCAPRPHVR